MIRRVSATSPVLRAAMQIMADKVYLILRYEKQILNISLFSVVIVKILSLFEV